MNEDMREEENAVEEKPATRSMTHKVSDGLDELIHTFIIAAIIAIGVRTFAFEPFNIPSSSMEPVLLIGDYLFVSKFSYGYSSLSTVYGLLPMEGRLFGRSPERGDVAVFKLPADNRTDYIKRIIGLPGDRIQMRQGRLYINNVLVPRTPLDEHVAAAYLTPHLHAVDYIETLPNGRSHIIREEGDDRDLDNTPVFEVPAGHYFAMGDNRDNSQDSRTPHVSYVPADNLVGRAEIIFLSFKKDVHFWQVWKWPFGIRWGRLFKSIT
ncbi:MAG: signal peptidase I [Alphaproteobacteria bacterium]|nr:signal peptidase I [Alphaproteobacteria bacterium]